MEEKLKEKVYFEKQSEASMYPNQIQNITLYQNQVITKTVHQVYVSGSNKYEERYEDQQNGFCLTNLETGESTKMENDYINPDIKHIVGKYLYGTLNYVSYEDRKLIQYEDVKTKPVYVYYPMNDSKIFYIRPDKQTSSLWCYDINKQEKSTNNWKNN